MANDNHVRVPQPSRASYNPQRLVTENTLLKNQIKHFHELEQTILRQLQTRNRFEDVKTEGDTAAYIKRVTGVLHPHLVKRKEK